MRKKERAMMKSFSLNKVMAMAVCCLALAGNAFALSQNASGVYQIGTCQDLHDFSTLVNGGNTSANAKLVADINMAECTSGGEIQKLTPIGMDAGKKYVGTFDGDGKIINALNISLSESDLQYGGLFGCVGSSGVVKNVIVYNINIIKATSAGKTDYIGGIAGWNEGTISTCTVAGTSTIQGRRNVGGIVGYAAAGTIEDCLCNASILATGESDYDQSNADATFAGGIVGRGRIGVQVTHCVYSGESVKRVKNSTEYSKNVFPVAGGPVSMTGCFFGAAALPSTGTAAKCGVSSGDHGDNAELGYCSIGYDKTSCTGTWSMGSSPTAKPSCKKNGSDVFNDSTNCRSQGGTWLSSACGAGQDDLSDSSFICGLNGGSWSSNHECENEDGPWTENGNISNQVGLQLNSDGTILVGAIFDANGGSLIENEKSVPSKTKWYSLYTNIDTTGIGFPTRTGYTFVGWGASDNATTAVSGFGEAAGTKTFYAIWNANNYTATFNANEGVFAEGAKTSKDVAYGSAISAEDIGTPTREGYAFKGWALASDAAAAAENLGTMNSTEGVTFYAVWDANEYTIAFNSNGGSEVSSIVADYGTAVTAPTDPTKTGYTFGGWFTDNETFASSFTFSTMPVDGATLYAKWTVKTEEIVVVYGTDATKDTIHVTVDVPDNAATRIAKAVEELASRTPAITPAKAEDEDSTYAFKQWNVDETTGAITAEFEGTPKYIEVVVGEDTIKVVVPEDAGSDPSGKISVDVVLVVDGDTVKVAVNDGDVLEDAAKEAMNGELPTKDDAADTTYEFKGWEQVTDSTGKPVVDENGNGIYEPVFEPIVKNVDIVVAYGTDLAKDTIHVAVPEGATDAQIQESISDAFLNHVPSIPMPTKDSDGKYTYTFDKFVKNEDTGVYEPHFVNNPLIFMVYFNLPEDGKLDTEFNGYVYGEMTMLPTAHIEGDSEWLFKGWYTEPDGFGTKVRYIGENEVGDKTVYPLFQKDIDYEANGVKGKVVVVFSSNVEKAIKRSLDGVIPEDYVDEDGVKLTFDSWKLNKNGAYVATFTEATGIKGFAAAHFSVAVNGHALEIVGAKNGVKIFVYDMRGRLVTTSLAMSATQRVEIAKTGSYVVRIGSESVRVNVR